MESDYLNSLMLDDSSSNEEINLNAIRQMVDRLNEATSTTTENVVPNVIQCIQSARTSEMSQAVVTQSFMRPPVNRTKSKKKPKVEKPRDDNINFLDPNVLAEIENLDNLPKETDFQYPTYYTTITVNGDITNVRFHEETLIKIVKPSIEVPRYWCNYGDEVHESYVPKIIKTPSARGRKKKVLPEADAKPRKKQGTGECFNSQLTFFIPTGQFVNQPREVLERARQNNINPYYQIKVFRPGKIQLPGMKPTQARDIIRAVDVVLKVLNEVLKPAEPAVLEYLGTSMKNYKVLLKLQPKQKLHLVRMLGMMLSLRDTEIPSHRKDGSKITIFDAIYNRENDTNLAISFATPVIGNPLKLVLVKIYMSSKINILGGRYMEDTKDVLQFVCDFIKDRQSELIIEEGLGYAKFKPGPPNIIMSDEPSEEILLRCDRLYYCAHLLNEMKRFSVIYKSNVDEIIADETT